MFRRETTRWGLAPSVGTVLGCSLGACVIWFRVVRRVNGVLEHSLLGQPFGPERSEREAEDSA